MEQEFMKELETPCIVIDREKMEENIRQMQEIADQAGVILRPHIKTHKIPEYARLQVQAGACGITCAKVSEAEVMADGGIKDIFIAYPLVGRTRLNRAMALAKRCDRLIFAVDSLETANMLSEAAKGTGVIAEVRLEIDTGARRTGVPIERAIELAAMVNGMEHLRMTGIYTFKSLVYQGKTTQDASLAAMEEGHLMAELAQEMRRQGMDIKDISAGSTPTGAEVAKTGCVTEIRPGTYVFNDYMLCCEKWAKEEKIAAHIYATVVSVPKPEYAVIDGGTKTFPMDILLDQPPYRYSGYAGVVGRPDLRLRRMNEEHGILESIDGRVELQVGEVLELTPVHICTAINLQNNVYEYDRGRLRKIPVVARGMLV